MKKLFAIILSAMLILTMCTVTAFAVDQNVTLEEVDGRRSPKPVPTSRQVRLTARSMSIRVRAT